MHLMFSQRPPVSLVVPIKHALCTDASLSGVLQGLVVSRSQEEEVGQALGSSCQGREIEKDGGSLLSQVDLPCFWRINPLQLLNLSFQVQTLYYLCRSFKSRQNYYIIKKT